MKIAFYIPNKNISDTDLSTVDEGNPGIGGSEFSAVLIASNLSLKTNFEIFVFCDTRSVFPATLKWQVCGDLIGAIKQSIKENIDYIVVDAKLLKKEILCKFEHVKFIAWANTFIPENYLDFFAKMNNVISIVNVGKEQMDLTKSHMIYKKSTYIYNAVPMKMLAEFPNLSLNRDRKNNVCYIGSLHPAKGFQYLAKAWPQVLLQVPDAQLFIIGSGNLYGRNSKLGKWGIANESFENEFMPFLTKNDKIIDSVHFLGILGHEKYAVLEKCKVGVPNPSGVSETFGYTAVEMQLMGCSVTTIKCPGYIDTVFNKENLYDNTNQLSAYIIKLLNENNFSDNSLVYKYLDAFSVENVVDKWVAFLLSLEKKTFFPVKKNKDLFLYKLLYYKKRFKYLLKSSLKYLLKK